MDLRGTVYGEAANYKADGVLEIAFLLYFRFLSSHLVFLFHV